MDEAVCLLYDISTELFVSGFFKRFLKAIIIMEIIAVKVRINIQSCISLLIHNKTRCEKNLIILV